MEIQPSVPPRVTRQERAWKTGIAIGVMVLCALAIGYLIVWGVDDNSLHASAMSWSFTLIAAVMAGLGVAGIAPQIVEKLAGR